MTDLLSKERLIELTDDKALVFPASHANVASMARELLQRREAAEKPVAEVNLVENEDRPWLDPKISIHLIDNLASCHLKDKDKLFASTPLTSAERERLTELERAHENWVDLNLRNAELCGKLKEANDRLAAYDRAAERPVAYMLDGEDGREYNGQNEFSSPGCGIPLFTAPPLPVVPDEMDDIKDEPMDIQDYIEIGKVQGWNACRAAMLQHVSLIDEGDNVPTRYMNRYTGQCFTLEQQPGADTDTDVYVTLYERQPGKGE